MKRPSRRFGIVLLACAALAAGCGPLGPLPGGKLSGAVAAAPTDWAESEAHKNVQLETRPSDPYSVNVWGAGLGDRFYVAAGEGADATWAQHIEDDPNVRLRIGETLYELRAVRVDGDAQERQAFLDAVKRKYDWEPDPEQSEGAWLYRLESR